MRLTVTNPVRAPIMNIWLGIGAVSAMLLSSCVAIQMNHYDSGSRSNVSTETISKLIPGVTTREEVLLLLGEPDYGYNDDELILAYEWKKVEGLNLFPGTMLYGTNYQLNIKFDGEDRVLEVGLIKVPRPHWTERWEL